MFKFQKNYGRQFDYLGETYSVKIYNQSNKNYRCVNQESGEVIELSAALIDEMLDNRPVEFPIPTLTIKRHDYDSVPQVD